MNWKIEIEWCISLWFYEPHFIDGRYYADIFIHDICLQVNDGIQVFSNAYNSSIKKLID